MSGPTILGKDDREFLAELGIALLQVKTARGLTLAQMGLVLGCCDDWVRHYIAGETEMGVLKWKRAHDEWPELVLKLEETAADRAMRAKQRSLDLPTVKMRATA